MLTVDEDAEAPDGTEEDDEDDDPMTSPVEEKTYELVNVLLCEVCGDSSKDRIFCLL